MKLFKSIIISSDGSFHFCPKSDASLKNKLIIFTKQDEKNFSLNQKRVKKVMEFSHLSYYKKKYLK